MSTAQEDAYARAARLRTSTRSGQGSQPTPKGAQMTESRVDDLVAFVRARIDEQRQAIPDAEAFRGPCTLHTVGADGWMWIEDADGYEIGRSYCCSIGSLDETDAAFFARRDPVHALADLDARKAVVDAYERSVRMLGPAQSVELRRLVVIQAVADADHPDYREEWQQ